MSLYVGAICAIPGFPGLNGAPFIGNHDDGYVGLSPTFKDHADNTFQTQRVYVVACNAPGGRVFNGLEMEAVLATWQSLWERSPADRWSRFCASHPMPIPSVATGVCCLTTCIFPGEATAVSVCVRRSEVVLFLDVGLPVYGSTAWGLCPARCCHRTYFLDPLREVMNAPGFGLELYHRFTLPRSGIAGFAAGMGSRCVGGTRNTYLVYSTPRKLTRVLVDDKRHVEWVGSGGYSAVSVSRHAGQVCAGSRAEMFVADAGKIIHVDGSGHPKAYLHLPDGFTEVVAMCTDSGGTVLTVAVSGARLVRMNLTGVTPHSVLDISTHVPEITAVVACGPGPDTFVVAGHGVVAWVQQDGVLIRRAVVGGAEVPSLLAVGPCGRLFVCTGTALHVFSVYDGRLLSHVPVTFGAGPPFAIACANEYLYAVLPSGTVDVYRLP